MAVVREISRSRHGLGALGRAVRVRKQPSLTDPLGRYEACTDIQGATGTAYYGERLEPPDWMVDIHYGCKNQDERQTVDLKALFAEPRISDSSRK